LNCLITLRQLEQGSSSVNIFIAPVEETLAQVTVPAPSFQVKKKHTPKQSDKYLGVIVIRIRFLYCI